MTANPFENELTTSERNSYPQSWGIRYRISVLLLLSALNIVAIVTILLILLNGGAAFSALGMTILIAWALAMALIFVFTAWRIRSLINEPLGHLSKAAIAIGQGNLDTSIHISNRSDEIGALAKAIDMMRDNLRSNIKALRRQNQRMYNVFNTMGDGVIVVDKQGRIQAFNRFATKLLGLRDNLSEGKEINIKSLEIPQMVEPVLSDAEEVPIEIRLPSEFADGQNRYSRVLRRCLTDEEGVSNGYVAVIQDITRDKELEQLKNDFFSMVTHELKTPLTVVEGYAKIILAEKPGPINDEQRKFMNIVLAQSTKLRRMIQDLLDVSRITSGKLTLDKKRTNIRDLLHRVTEQFRPEAEQRGLELSFNESTETGLTGSAMIDSIRMEQAIGNLLGNAMKFTEKGGQVTVSFDVEEAHLIIRVRDTGIGIPTEDIDRIFDKFYQVEKGDSRGAGGAGLGLYICKELIIAHGGDIGAGSSGKGSVFTIRLPLGGESSDERTNSQSRRSECRNS